MTLLIGVGNGERGDDGVGPWVVDRVGPLAGVRRCQARGEGTELMALWRGADGVILVDAMVSGAPAGTVRRLDAGGEDLPRGWFGVSSHGFGLAEAVALGRVLGELPARREVYGVEGEAFGPGRGLSPAVEAAARTLVTTLQQRLGP